MRTRILATASAIVLGIGAAGALYAADPGTVAQTPAATGTMQPAAPSGGATTGQMSAQTGTAAQPATPRAPSTSGHDPLNSSNSAAASQSKLGGQQVSQNDVVQAQQKLAQEGLYRGTIDGRVGPGTQQALRAYQRKNDLPQTGTLDQQTLASLSGP